MHLLLIPLPSMLSCKVKLPKPHCPQTSNSLGA